MKRSIIILTTFVLMLFMTSCVNSSESSKIYESSESNKTCDHETTINSDKTEIFTNKYGTPTTKCSHSGCTNYIASSGDTNCCTNHSNRCLECNKYIDEDALYCISCIEEAANKLKSENHTCEECNNVGTYTITGFSGQTEYYCYKHYSELMDMMDKIS